MNHIEEEILEAYLLGRLPAQQTGNCEEPGLVSVEEHLLICSPCIERAEELDATISLLKTALADVAMNRHRRRKQKVMTASGSPYSV
jgi:anti-sigma factor RsiW